MRIADAPLACPLVDLASTFFSNLELLWRSSLLSDSSEDRSGIPSSLAEYFLVSCGVIKSAFGGVSLMAISVGILL